MEQTTIYQTINQLGKWLEEGGYSKNTIYQFKSTTNQLIKFMESKGIQEFNTTTGLAFLQEQYSIDPGKSKGSINYVRYGFMRKLSDFQLQVSHNSATVAEPMSSRKTSARQRKHLQHIGVLKA